MQQAVLNDIELQFANRADDLSVPLILREQLSDSLIGKLLNSFGQLLRLHWIGVDDFFEELWRKIGDTLKQDGFAFCQRIADLEIARVIQPDDISREGIFDECFLPRHKTCGVSEPEVFP